MIVSIEVLMSANVVGSITDWAPRQQELVLLTFIITSVPGSLLIFVDVCNCHANTSSRLRSEHSKTEYSSTLINGSCRVCERAAGLRNLRSLFTVVRLEDQLTHCHSSWFAIMHICL